MSEAVYHRVHCEGELIGGHVVAGTRVAYVEPDGARWRWYVWDERRLPNQRTTTVKRVSERSYANMLTACIYAESALVESGDGA